MMTQTNSKTQTMALMLVLTLTLISGAQAAEKHQFSNGICATVFSADEIRINPAVTGISLAAVESNYVPFDQDDVVAALEAMHGFDIDLNVDVYLLPAPPAQINSSYAKGNSIYLAPGLGNIAASTQAYVVTHEMGHVLTSAYMDNSNTRWDAYLQLRGLNLQDNGPSAAHADRAREIVAEDFRFLFGGALANENGSIENHSLALPNTIIGLEDLMLDFLSEKPLTVASSATAKAFPNPCNPRTTIQMALPAGTSVQGSIRLSIYDIRGSLVRTIDGGQVDGSQINVDWNGNNDQGYGVSSGRYVYVLQAGSVAAKGSVTLVR